MDTVQSGRKEKKWQQVRYHEHEPEIKNLNAVAMEFQDTFSADRNEHSSILQMQSANKVN